MKHHSHQVLIPKVRGKEKPISELARQLGCKVTRIGREVMLTRYFYTHDVEAIKKHATDLASRVEQLGWTVIKTKVEHEGLHLVKEFTKDRYAETHIKVSIPKMYLGSKLALLQEVAPKKGFHLSKNPLEQTTDAAVYFVNFRFEEGTPSEAHKVVNETIMWLGASNYDMLEIKRELVVYAQG